MPTVQRNDYVPIRDYHFDDQTGFLYVYRVPIAGAMVQRYAKSDGTEQKEAKLPEEILSDPTVMSANSKPVTDGHHGLVTKENSRELMKGFTASNAHVEGDMLYDDIVITDADLIDQIKNGNKRELSIGFETRVDPTSGTYKGTKYDSVQRNIRINHVAVVPKGRAGHQVRIFGDSADAVDPMEPSEKGNQMETRVVRADGQNITVAADDVDKITKLDADNSAKAKQIAELDAQIKKLQAEKAQLQGNADESAKKADAAEAKVASLEDDKKKLQKQVDQLKGDAFDERMNLIDQVKDFVGDSAYDYHGKSDRDMKIDAVKAVRGDAIDFKDKSDDFVDAAFMLLEKPKQVSGYAGPAPETKGDSQEDYLMALRDKSYGY